ncbi:hypothetical protein M406DRAFT_295918 [Cryphonectria parasitica EP155]|uniref:Btz domain-containing protein n=1 Tax=Cryphonectria parasitica (strain ATCC 38755 / EP155) TaxID=660469 RepID=A0A9P5CII8_CRYP1|nr:uncharacterized protein M406DRAFT_295918 [Cryphonectria parasitica EP155]KAF3760563.1 hypothetical protein M406DRAFT_295918 [Cryphonectria parasitica EP155]
MGAPPKRSSRRTLGHRRRVDDEGDDEGGPETLDHLDDDSVTEGSVITDEHDRGDDSDTSNVDEASPTSPVLKKAPGRRAAKGNLPHLAPAGTTGPEAQVARDVAEAEVQLNGLNISDEPRPTQEETTPSAPTKPTGPVVVSSTQVQAQEPPFERRRREHEEYRKKRDEDPAFVPNRGAFFMHDHRHAGPAANGFRPFGRGALRGGRGRGRGVGAPFAPIKYVSSNPLDPTVSGPWAHDMHEAVAEPLPMRQPRHAPRPVEGPPNGDGHIPTRPSSDTPINRTLSTEKTLGYVEVRMFFPGLKEPKSFSSIPMKRYIMLPDHRPPLRRDKAVRICLPRNPPRYVFPAADRSFIFIPRAMRPNQQHIRGRSRTGFGSVGGYSRRTSIYGGSYYGSAYTPSVGMSRRSSIAPGDFISPTGSAMSRPIVRLPPMMQPQVPVPMPMPDQPSITDLPQPQTYPLPQKPAFQENRPDDSIPMHQPRPQKAVSLENIESPTRQTRQPPQFQQAFHQQVPPQMVNSLSLDTHGRNPPYPSQISTGTPLSQIPERAIHAAPFQPSTYSQPPPGYYSQPYPMLAQPPRPQQQQQGYYYPQPPQPYANNMASPAAAPPFYPGGPQAQAMNYGQGGQGEGPPVQANTQGGGSSTLVAQDVNGTVYYYDASQIPTYPTYPAYGAPGYAPNMTMGMSPAPEGYYYNQAAQGMTPY